MKTLSLGLGLVTWLAVGGVVSVGGATVTVTADREIVAGDRALDGADLVVRGARLTVAGPHAFASLQLLEGAVLTHAGATNGEATRAIRLGIAGDLTVDRTSRIDATAKGYSFPLAPGAGSHGAWSGGGGGHGGDGGAGAGVPPGTGGGAFDSVLAPDAWGGPGAPGGDGILAPGGGLVRLEVGGVVRLEGSIRADGQAGVRNDQGGGAGGTVHLQAASLEGAGSISADGGRGEWYEGGGGAGGRVALVLDREAFPGSITALGGAGANWGGGGTVYRRVGGGVGEVRVANAGPRGWTPIEAPVAFGLVVETNALVYAPQPVTLGSLMVKSGGMLSHPPGGPRLEMRVTGQATVESGGAIAADGRGYPVGTERGPGSGRRLEYAGSGGGHGGWGGDSKTGAEGGTHYGSVMEPETFGSQGGDSTSGSGAAGGGMVRLSVDGRLKVDGRISANGLEATANDAGGGAGGSVWLTVGALEGNGQITAHGGAGEWFEGGGGAGGRVAVHHQSASFTGKIAAWGFGGARRAGAGTVYLRTAGATGGLVIVDNGGDAGSYTPLGLLEREELVVSGRGQVSSEGRLAVQALLVRSNGILAHPPGHGLLDVRVSREAVIDADGWVSADGRGFPSGGDRGPGAGQRKDWSGSGGGHGGTGGRSTTGGVGGVTYGSLEEPVAWGSQGGDSAAGPGAAGGGAVRMVVEGRLTVEGRISADGSPGSVNDAGGGAGGSVYLSVGSLVGRGVVSASGGAGEWHEGGGGSGGRISVHGDDSGFAGTMMAWGGAAGFERGGAGTVYTRIPGNPRAKLRIDNGDLLGAHTPLVSLAPLELTIAGRAQVHPVGILTVQTLEVLTNGILTHPTGQERCHVVVLGDATVRPGGSISVEGRGYPVLTHRGPGAGVRRDWSGSGAGHGGEGGRSVTDGVGGGAYGSVMEPDTLGSQGGDSSSGAGSPGGGVVRLVVGGRLTVDGRISASGMSSTVNDAGGGSGGSLYIDAGILEGTGILAADGGSGEWFEGGGGAGGRMALVHGMNRFSGVVSAMGGGGRERGGAGTVYLRGSADRVGQVWMGNGGMLGAHTPITWPEALRVVIGDRAQVYPPETVRLQELEILTNGILTHPTGFDRADVVVLGDANVRPGGVISADGRGYPVGGDPGPGAGGLGDWAGSGAGHGGAGGASVTRFPGGGIYGSRWAPRTLGSQGGSSGSGPGSAGGGAVRLVVGGTLTIDGALRANGLDCAVNDAGGGAGGSVLAVARALAGSGAIQARGGAGEWHEGGGGGGGRIALYQRDPSFGGTLDARGGEGAVRGLDGSVFTDVAPGVVWLSPGDEWLWDTVSMAVAAVEWGDVDATVEFSLWREGHSVAAGAVPLRLTAETALDTRQVPDGVHELRAVVRDASGRWLAEGRQAVRINNSVTWRTGGIRVSETWGAGRVYAVEGDLVIPTGVTLTLEAGVVVKFLPGARLVIHSGGKLVGPGTGSDRPVVLTSFLDDSAGGDSNLDGAGSRPTAGSWRLVQSAGGTVAGGENLTWRYQSQSYGGALAGSVSWSADSLREVTTTVVVPAGATLRIEAGATVKFAPGTGLDIQRGGALEVLGTVAQPVVLTSVRDDAYAGDSNGDGSLTVPAAGDWRSLRLLEGAEGRIEHAMIRFGGNSVGNPWGAGGALESLGAPLVVRQTVIAEALKDGAYCQGPSRFENCLVLRCDRGLTAAGPMEVVHATVDGCRIGLLEHAGRLTVRNTLVAHSMDVGMEHDLGTSSPVVEYCNVWNPTARFGNYRGTPDRTGRDGNLSAEPRFRDYDADNLRLTFLSPGIDAAAGEYSSGLDLAGAPRFDDPRTGNAGTPAPNGAVPDIGAYEFVDHAPSSIDVAVTEVRGPSELLAGGVVRVEWVVVNRGAEAFSGPWHDALYLSDATTGTRLWVAEPLVGRGVSVGPGQAQRVSADVRIPGGADGDYRWVVAGNSRGDLFEGTQTTNNEAVSAASAALRLPRLIVDGSAVSAHFGAQEEQHWFECVEGGKDIRFELDLGADSGITELYVGRGFVPTPERFTARQREYGRPDTSAVVSAAREADGAESVLYVLAIGRSLAGVPVPFALRAVSASFGIDQVLPSRVGNGGLVTLEVRGSVLGPDVAFRLRVAELERSAVRVSRHEAGRAYATFDMTGIPAGFADFVASSGGLEVVRAGAVAVTEGGAGEFYAMLQGPKVTRAGRMTSWFVTYGNRGTVDVRLPLLRFAAPGATEIRLFDHTANWADSFTFLALHPDVLLPTLGPGQEATLEVRVKVFAPTRVTLDLVSGDALAASTVPMRWASRPPPEGADPTAWSAWMNGLTRRVGATVGEYAGLLERDLAGLRDSPLRYSYLANVNGRWLAGDEAEGVEEEWPIVPISPEEEAEGMLGPGLKALGVAGGGDGIRRTWFVIITMEDYSRRRAEGRTTKDTPAARTDFNDLSEYLSRDLRVPPEQISAGHDAPGDGAAWTRANMVSALTEFRGRVDADDNLVVVYSGHGGKGAAGTGFLVPNGGPALSPTAFARAMDEVGAGATYFINNSCHSEAFNEFVRPTRTRFVGFAATRRDRLAFGSTAGGSPAISQLKGQLRKCRSLGMAFELTETLVTHRFRNRIEREQQHPVLTNPASVSLDGKPWADPGGIEQELERSFAELEAAAFGEADLGIVGSVDPNDKVALAGSGPERWVGPRQLLPFEIAFENRTNAAAPAQEVLVIDDLDAGYDWSTFELKTIAFGDTRIEVPPGRQRFHATTGVGTDPNPVDVEVRFDPVRGRIEWRMRSLDVATGELPEDPYAGFLPPNDATRRGEGLLTFSVRPRVDFPDGGRLVNRATIVFDPTYGANPPIVTPAVTNTVDAVPPVSAVLPIAAPGGAEAVVSWEGQDSPAGSGILSFDVYVSGNGAPYRAWLLGTTNRTTMYRGESGVTYRFYSVARDAVGNTEDAPRQPDASVAFAGGASVRIVREGGQLRLLFEGNLESAPTILGPWTRMPGVSGSAWTLPTGTERYFRAYR